MTGPADRPAVEPDRWNLNLVAVAVVVAVVLAGVLVWIVTGDGDDQAGGGPADTPATSPPIAPTTSAAGVDPAPTTTVAPSAPPTTSAQPMPEVTTSTDPTTTTAPPPAPTTPVTAAAAAGPNAVPGDLGIDGRPMERPPCDGAYITIVASALGRDASAAGIAGLLEQHPGADYLRTDQTCPSLAQSADGEPIYVVYLGPFAVDTDACEARSSGPPDAYARRLSSDPGGGNVTCAPTDTTD